MSILVQRLRYRAIKINKEWYQLILLNSYHTLVRKRIPKSS